MNNDDGKLVDESDDVEAWFSSCSSMDDADCTAVIKCEAMGSFSVIGWRHVDFGVRLDKRAGLNLSGVRKCGATESGLQKKKQKTNQN